MFNRTRAALFVSFCLTGGLLAGCQSASPDSDADSEEVAAVGEAASACHEDDAGLPPTKELAKQWTRWALGQPWSTGPITDPTGEACADGQNGHDWFLAGTPGGPVTRSCTIPHHKELFFPLVNQWCTFPPEWYPDQASIDADLPLIKGYYADNLAHTCSLTVKVDGQDAYEGGFVEMVDDLWVEIDKPFQANLNPDNFITALGYDIAGGDMPVSTSGHFARLKPLPPGDHVIELGGSLCDGSELWFETSATYHLHVLH
ncbi:MAG: hypothetical protein U0441_14375 [Polyangiaceae bacterium]